MPNTTEGVQPYQLFMFCGILPWTWFSSSLSEAANSLIAGGNLIKKVLFPAEVLPLVSVLTNMVHFFLGLPILIWQREGYARPDVRAELQDLLSRAVLADLPLWIEALRRSDSGARHVTLLWDDPTCLPDVHATAGTAWSEE